jgi:hypothetical protein
MKYFLISTLYLLGQFFCKKDHTPPSFPPRPYIHRPVDTINRIIISVAKNITWDTAGAVIRYFNFHTAIDPLGLDINDGSCGVYWRWGEDTAVLPHNLNYLGKVPLFHRDSIKSGEFNNAYLMYAVDSSLYNRPIFQDCIRGTDSIWKTYIMRKGGTIAFEYFFPDSNKVARPQVIPLDSITNAYNYYISNLKQTNYHFTLMGLGYVL